MPTWNRKSYHDLESLRPMKVLSPDRMKIDVELCAQVLIMVRREEHLRNVVACLEVGIALGIYEPSINGVIESNIDALHDKLVAPRRL